MMLSDATITAMIVGTVALLSPVILSIVNSRMARKDKQADYARQDAVAANLLERQDQIAAKAEEAAKLLVVNTQKVAEATKETSNKLDVIHILVNSQMTAALKSEHDAVRREYVLLEQVIALNEAAGRKPSTGDLAELKNAKTKIEELSTVLIEREARDKEAKEAEHTFVATAQIAIAQPKKGV